jgi:CRISP-associated protein Cas1
MGEPASVLPIALCGEGWAERCAYWLSNRPQKRRYGPPPRQSHEPLILTGHGMSLRVDHGALVVRNGFTHYPRGAEEHRFLRGDRHLPSRIIVIDGSGALSFDVLSWLSEQHVPLIRINWRGEVVTALGAGYAANPTRIAAQLEAHRNGSALPFARSLVREKIRNSIETLSVALPQSATRDLAIANLNREANELAKRPPGSLNALHRLQGRAAFAYFNGWKLLPLRWKGPARHPIPADWYHVAQRQSLAKQKPRNRNASHPVHAILNYAYAVLESQVRTEVLAQGFDPTIGILHASKPDRGAFVLDLMEPLRPIADRKVLEFVQAHVFHPADFTIRSDGVCRLNSEMARLILRIVTTDPGDHPAIDLRAADFIPFRALPRQSSKTRIRRSTNGFASPISSGLPKRV